MKNHPPKPKLDPKCASLVEQSELELVLCGGLQVGMNTSPLVWRLRPKNELAREKQRTKDLQKTAQLARENHKLHAETNIANSACIDIFHNYEKHEISRCSLAIQRAWGIGRDLDATKD